MLLIIGSRQDDHVAAVTSLLKEWGSDFRIFDPALGHTNSFLTLSSEDDGGRIRQLESSFEIQDISSVWYRSSQLPELENAGSEIRARFYKNEWRDAQLVAYRRMSGPAVRWTNHPRAVARSAERIHALGAAAKLGFKAPATLSSNSFTAVSDFVRRIPVVVAKPFQSIELSNNTRSSAVTFAAKHLAYRQSIEMVPSIFQERERTQRQLRIICLGRDVFGAGLTTDEGCDVDVRNELSLRGMYEQFEVPDDLRSLCQRLTARFELEYAALDIGLQDDGSWVIFDINPFNNFRQMEKFAPWLRTTERFAKHLICA